jgi:cytochrome c oxidase subunit 2
MFESLLGFWLPPDASTYAHHVDALYWFIFWLSVVNFVLILAGMGWLLFRYRRTSTEAPKNVLKHSRTLELTWTVVPTIFCVIIFYMGFVGFMDIYTIPEDAYQINVEVQQFGWTFTYPESDLGSLATGETVMVNGEEKIVPVLYLEVGTPTKLLMRSKDVIHSLFIPAFRAKRDIVPGRYNTMWFEPTREGRFPLYCTEYCGDGHSNMAAVVVVVPQGNLKAQLTEFQKGVYSGDPARLGELLYATKGCAGCHSVDGSRKVGPSFKDIWNRKPQFTDGSTLDPNEPYENYILESIRVPGAHVVAGYENKMPPYPEATLPIEEVEALMAYMKKVSGIETAAPAEDGEGEEVDGDDPAEAATARDVGAATESMTQPE